MYEQVTTYDNYQYGYEDTENKPTHVSRPFLLNVKEAISAKWSLSSTRWPFAP